jgi:serine protease DegQ
MHKQRHGVAAATLCAGLLISSAACTIPPAAPSPSTATSVPPTSAPAGGSTGDLSNVPGIVREVEASVITILTANGLGSGVVYRADGTIVTDAHVIEDENKQPFDTVQVQFADGSRSAADVVAVDDPTDVGVIKAQRGNLPAATFATSAPIVGQLAVVLGSPLGLAETVTAGIVSALHRNMPPSPNAPQGILDLIQTDAPISPGNSGGAVVDVHARMIGLSESYLPPSSGAVAIGFVTPAATVTEVADQLLENGVVRRAFLGVVPAEITPQIAQRFGLTTTKGALVIQLSENSPAAAAGIRAGDIITKFDGTSIASVTDLLAAIRDSDPGDRVRITVVRGSSEDTVAVTLGDTENQR